MSNPIVKIIVMKLNKLLLDIANNIRFKLANINEGTIETTKLNPQEFSVKIFSIAYPTLSNSMVDALGSGLSNIKEITVHDSITNIESGAFASIKNMHTFIVHQGLESIGDGAFKGCSSLAIINLGDCVNLTSIGTYAFAECSSLGNITIPSGVTSIESYTFHKAKFTSLSLEGVTTIKINAFAECNAEKIIIPSQVTNIEAQAFKGCSRETCIEVDEGNEVYDSRYNCNAIIETETDTLIQGMGNTTIPSDVVALGDHAFFNSTMKDIYIPESVESLGIYCFSSRYLKKIEFDKNSKVTALSYFLFGSSYELESIVFPPRIEALPSNAFYYNPNLTLLDFRNYSLDEPPTLGGDIFNGNKEKIIIVVPNAEMKTKWAKATNWSIYVDNIKTLDEYNASLQV